MPDPASEEQLIAELTESCSYLEENELNRRILWLRSALRSHLAWAIESTKLEISDSLHDTGMEYRANLLKLTEDV